jgi:hypothetical protein
MIPTGTKGVITSGKQMKITEGENDGMLLPLGNVQIDGYDIDHISQLLYESLNTKELGILLQVLGINPVTVRENFSYILEEFLL